jgi:hypothetical protein
MHRDASVQTVRKSAWIIEKTMRRHNPESAAAEDPFRT